MSSAALPGWAAKRSHRRRTPAARAMERSPGWRPLQRGVRRPVDIVEGEVWTMLPQSTWVDLPNERSAKRVQELLPILDVSGSRATSRFDCALRIGKPAAWVPGVYRGRMAEQDIA